MLTLYIGHQAFSGPYDSVEPVTERAGVYAILSHPGRTQKIHCLDQSANLRTTLSRRLKTGPFAGRSDLAIAVHYMPGVQASGRQRLVDKLLSSINLE